MSLIRRPLLRAAATRSTSLYLPTLTSFHPHSPSLISSYSSSSTSSSSTPSSKPYEKLKNDPANKFILPGDEETNTSKTGKANDGTHTPQGVSLGGKGTDHFDLTKNKPFGATAFTTGIDNTQSLNKKSYATTSSSSSSPSSSSSSSSEFDFEKGEGDKATDLLKADHAVVESLFKEWPNASPSRSQEILTTVTQELSKHAAIEEQVFYPAMNRVLKTNNRYQECLEDHLEVKKLLQAMKGEEVNSSKFKQMRDELMKDIREHVKKEEEDLFPRVEREMDLQNLKRIGYFLQAAKKIAPLEPHPGAPNTPPWNVIAGPFAAFLDRVKNAVSSK